MIEIEDLSDLQAFVQSAFKVLGLWYDSPRVVSFISRVEAARVARGLRDFQPWRGGGWRHTIDSGTYRSLAINLADLILRERESFEPSIDLDMAIAQIGTLKLAIAGAKK